MSQLINCVLAGENLSYTNDFTSKVAGLKQSTTKNAFIQVGKNTKYCPFIVSLEVDKPAVDCELEPNNQSAVVSIVMLSPMGKKEWQRDT